MSKRPHIFTFYSYKGGVGRTQMTANLSAYLCYYLRKRILLIDWDMEAPGLHYYFGKTNKDIDKPGVIETLQDYVRKTRQRTDWPKEEIPHFSEKNILPMSASKDGKGRIDLIPAATYNAEAYKKWSKEHFGSEDTRDFHARCNDFKWDEYHEMLGGSGHVEYLKESLKNLDYDLIFVDSRTGLNDYSGICNIQLPDANILAIAPSEQNFEGAKEIADKIIGSPYITSGKYRKAHILPVLSRLDIHAEKHNDWVVKFIDKFYFLIPNITERVIKNPRAYFKGTYLRDTTLYYNKTFAVGENIFYKSDQTELGGVGLTEQYKNLAEIINGYTPEKGYAIEVKRNPNDIPETEAEAYFQMGNSQVGLGKYEDAIESYTQAIEIKPDYAYAYNNRGNAYRNLGDYEKAIDDYSKAIEINPDFAEAYHDRYISYRDLEDFSKAIQIKLGLAGAYYNRGHAFFDLKDYEKAIEDYSEAIEINPDYAEAYNSRGITYGNLDDCEKAIDDYSKAIEIKPDYADACINRGNAYLYLNQYKKAIDDYNKALEIKSEYFEGYNNRGNAYLDLKDYEKAIEDFNKAIEIKPDYFEAYYNRGITYGNLEDYEKAIEDFSKAIEIKPDFASAYNNRGYAYGNLEDYEKAIEDFSKAIEIKPDDADAYNNRGNAYRNLEDYEKAIDDYNKAIEIKPDYAGVVHCIGWTYFIQAQYQKAKPYFEKAMELNVKDAHSSMNLGHIVLTEGKKEEAIKLYRQSRRLWNDDKTFFDGMRDDFQYLQNLSKEEYEEILRLL